MRGWSKNTIGEICDAGGGESVIIWASGIVERAMPLLFRFLRQKNKWIFIHQLPIKWVLRYPLPLRLKQKEV
jgi:hypothetical protein